MKEKLQNPVIKTTAVIFLCFLLTSTGWLSWEYHLMEQVPSRTSDLCTMVAGYLLQAAGIGLFALLLRSRRRMAEWSASAALILHMAFMFPAVLSPYTAGTLAFGFLMNICCGLIAGSYLFSLTKYVDAGKKATAFGIGYGLAILAS